MFSLLNRMIYGFLSRFLNKLRSSKVMAAAVLMMAFAAAGIFGADLTYDSNQTEVGIKTQSSVDIDADITITTLKILNRTENAKTDTVIIDLKGHTLTVGTLKIGAYSLLGDKLSGSVKFVDSIGTGTVIVDTLDATAYYYQKWIEIESPVTMEINSTFNTTTQGEFSSLTISGNGNLVVNAKPTNTAKVTATGVNVTGTEAASLPTDLPAQWTGAVSNDWANLANWTGISAISDLQTEDTVTIPAGLTRYPVASAATPVTLNGKLIMESGASALFAGSTTLNKVDAPDAVITTGTSTITFNNTTDLGQLTLGSGATVISKADLTLGTLSGAAGPDTTKLRFNQGAGGQTTAITAMTFNGSEIDFGNADTDTFTLGAGAGTLDISATGTVKLAGTINSSNLTLNASPSLAADTTLPKVTLAYDTDISGAGYSLKLTDSLDSATAATPRSLTVTANKVLLQYLDPVSDGPKIGAINKLKDITFNCDYEGKNGSNISCTGNLTVNGGAQFRGDITAYSIKVTKAMTFGGMCHSVETVKDQDYTSQATDDAWGVTLWRNDADNPLQLYSTDGGTITFHGNINSYNYDSTARQIKLGSMGSIYAGKPATVIINGKVGNVYQLDFIEINANIEFHDTVNAKSLSLTSDITTATIYNNITTSSTYKTESYSQHYEGNVTLKGNANLIAGTNPITFNGTVDSDGTPRSLTIGNATNASKVTFAKNVGGTNSLNNLTFYSGLTLKDTVTKVNVSSWNNEGSGTVTPGSASTVTVTKDIAGSTNTFNNLTIAGTGTSRISGDNTVNGDFTCTQAGKTLSFEAGKTLTVAGNFTITGEAASKITLNSQTPGTQWTLTTPAGDADVTHAIVKDSKSTDPSIRPSYSTNSGNNTNWIFAANYRWLSTTAGTDWETAANWQVESSAGNWAAATDFPGNGSDEDTVTVAVNANSKYPVYSSASKGIILDSLSIETDAAASINTTYNIQLAKASSPLTNKGTVIFQNTGRFIDTTLPTAKYLVDATQGTVEFAAGSSTVENINPADDTAADYNNVIVSGAVKLAGNIKTNGSFTVSQALDGNSKALNIGTKLTATASITDVTTLTVNGDASIGADITTSDAQNYKGNTELTDSITLNANGKTVDFAKTVKSRTGSTYDLTVTDSVTLHNTVSNIKDFTADLLVIQSSPAAGSAIDITGNLKSLSTSAASMAYIRGNINAASVEINGPLTFGKDTRTVTTTGTQNYRDTVSINSEAAGMTLTLLAGTAASPSDITFSNTINAYKNGANPATKTSSLIIGSSTIKSNVKFEDSIGTTYRLKSVAVYGTSEFVTGKSYRTLDSQTYSGQTKLPAAISFYSKDTAAGTVTFTGDVINASATPSALTIEEGNATFGNAGTSASPLGAVKAKGTLTTTASKNIYAASLSVTGTTANAGIINTSGLQEYTGAVTNTGTINVPSIASGTAVEFKGGFSGAGSLVGAKTSGTDLTPDPDIVFSGGTVVLNSNFSQNDDNVKFAPATTCSFNSNSIELSKVEFAGTGTTTLTSGLTCNNLTLSGGTLASGTNDITVNSDWSHSGGTFTSSSTVTVKGNVSGTNSFNTLVLYGNLSGNHTSITSLTIEGTGSSDTTEISGSNKIGTLTCIIPSKKINFTGATTQTVTELNINGQAGTTPVILNSSDDSSKWNITLTDDANSTVLYSHIKNSTSDNGGTKTIHTHLSKNLGGNTRWIFAENYTWTGADSTDRTNWDNYKNWKITVAGTEYPAVSFPGESSEDDTVTVANVTNKPVFSQTSRTVESLTVNAGSSLTFNSANDLKIKNSTAGLTNNGNIIYSSSGRVKNNAATPAVIMDGVHGKTVFNAGSGTVEKATTGVTGKNYYDLEINDSVSLAATGITAAHDFTLSSSGMITAGGDFTVDGKSSIGAGITTSGSQKYTGQITFNASALTFSAPSKTITFTGDAINGTGITSSVTISSGDVTFANAGTSASPLGAVTAGGKLTTTASKNIYAASLSVTGATSNAGIINTSGLQEYTGAVTNTGTINVPSIASGTAVEFKGGLSGAGSLIGAKTSGTDLTPDPDIVFSGGTASFGTFTPNNDTVVFRNNVTLGSALTCYDLVIDTGANLSAQANSITVNRNWNNKGTFTAGTSTVTVAKNIDGKTTFNILTITNASDTTVISDDNTIGTFTCETPSKVIVINRGKTQTVTSKLTLDGKAVGTEITLKSDSASATSSADQWNITTTGATTNVKYVKVQNSKSTELITTSLSASMGNNINWAIASDFKWTGNGADTNWKTPANWVTVYSSTEYLTNDYPGKWGTSNIFDTADISTTAVADKWPVFSETANSLKVGKISIGTNGSLTLTGSKDLQLNDSTTPISNAGKIIYSSTGRLKNNAATPAPVMDITKGLVIYNGNADKITNINTRGAESTEPSDYYNLKIEIDILSGGCITVANNFTLDDGKNITTTTDGYRFIVRKEASLGGSITTTDLQKYQGKVTLTQDITLKAKNNITFESNATITGASYNLTLDNDGTHQADYDLKKDVTVKSLTANIATGKKLSVPSPVVITAKEGFTVTGAGTVNLGTESQTADTKIITEKKDINFSGTGTVTVNSPVVLDTTSGAASASGNITIANPFQGKTAASQPLTIKAGTGNVNLQADMGTTVSLGDVTITDKDTTLSQSKELKAKTVAITGAKIKAEQASKITAAQTVTLTNSDLFLTEKGTVITALTGFTKTGTGLSQIAGTVRTSNSAISFNNTTYIYNASAFDTSNNGAVASPTADITIGSGTTDDLYISALEGTSAQAVSFTARTLDVKGNIVLFNGNVSLKAGMKSGMDIVLLNGNTDTMYDLGGVDDLIAYLNPLRSTTALKEPSLSVFPASLPDGTAISHLIYRSSLTNFNSKTIYAGQNFYDNGVNLEPAGDWTLSLKSNDDATVSFAEAYNARIKNCKTVTSHDGTFAWLAAGEGCTDAGNNSTDTTDSIDYGTDDGTGKFNCTQTGIAFLHPLILADDNSKTASEGRTTGPEIPLLSGTYAVRDNVIRIEFVRNNCTNGVVPAGKTQKFATSLIENSNNEIWNAVSQFKFNDGTSAFTGAYIDAECTVKTTGQGDLAVIYIKASSRWNLDATGTSFGTKADTTGSFHNDVYNDIYFQKIVAGVFATLYDNHKNRIADYSQVPYARPTPDHREGFRFTAVTNRCSIDDMHIIFTIADFESNKVYVYFDDALSNDRINWNHSDASNPVTTESTIKIYSDINTRTAINVNSVDVNTLNDHGIILTLDQNLGYDMINYGIKVEYASGNLLSTKIQSKNNRIVNNGESHCISDVITANCVDVQYAYDNRNDAYIDSTGGLAPVDSIVMRDFTGEGIHNKVFADKNITLVTKNIAPADAKGNAANFKYKLIADITPTPNCDGTTYEVNSGNKTRFWFPEGTATVSGFAPVLNGSPNRQTASSAAGSNIEESSDPLDPDVTTYLFHNFSEETPCLNWQSGSDVRFLFEVLKNGSRVMINHKFDGSSYNNGSEMTPLYLARLKNPTDLTSIDLWSFVISEPQRQRSGVSIYSNVVNATSKEFCTLEVNMPRDGNLRVIIMTADGNVVKYLESGRQTAGLHYYYWNGTNNSGKEVARGIYFIRVVGPDIEETRKVMVVK